MFIYLLLIVFSLFECYHLQNPEFDQSLNGEHPVVRNQVASPESPLDTNSLEDTLPKANCHWGGRRNNTKNLPCLPIIIKRHTVFFVSYFDASYYDSLKFCCEHGMKLVNIKSNEKNELIRDLISARPDKYALWTSGNRLADGKTLTWGDGMPVNFTKWWTGEPNNVDKNEDCMVIFSTAEGTGTWADKDCKTKWFFICEKPLYD